MPKPFLNCAFCNAPFEANRPWQRFCCPEHKELARRTDRAEVARLLARIELLEAELAAVRKRLGE